MSLLAKQGEFAKGINKLELIYREIKDNHTQKIKCIQLLMQIIEFLLKTNKIDKAFQYIDKLVHFTK